MAAEPRPSLALEKKRAEARDYIAKVVAPLVEGAVAHVTMQRKEPSLDAVLKYLNARAAARGDKIVQSEPSGAPPCDAISLDLLAPIVVELVKEMPASPQALDAFISKVEAAISQREVVSSSS